MKHSLVLALVLCACEASVGVGVGGNGVDASNGNDPDASALPEVDAPTVVPPDAATATCANGRVVFLSFEGEALTKAAVSDAKTNQASWMQIASGAAPAYHAASATRATEIQDVVDGVRGRLASFPIEVVTTRPASGDYVMVVFGGERAAVGSRFGAAVQELDCGDLTRNDVAWVADSVAPNRAIVNTVIGAIGFGLGLTATTTPTDCMCAWDNDCTPDNTVKCTLTPGITRDPLARQLCSGAAATQDEVATFSQGFCQ